MSDRIKLALAIGWKRVGRTAKDALYYPPGTTSFGPFGSLEPPDPFTDANDDYAVLEWMRNSDDEPRFTDFRDALRSMNSLEKGAAQCSWSYQIGDYARAALKALKDGD